MKSNSVIRIRILSFFIIAFGLFIIARLYILQIVEHDAYTAKADKQYSRTSSSLFSRGTIYFTNRDETLISAATLKTGFTLAINPQLVDNPDVMYNKLNPVVPLAYDSFIAKATKKNDPYEEIAKRVDYTLEGKLNDLNIKGLQLYKDRWRYYPAGNLASHVIGFLGYKGDEYAGRYGLESYYENTLKRSDSTYVNFFAQIFANIQNSSDDFSEGDIVTSIEPHVQAFFQDELKKVNEQYKSEYTAGIIMNPKTGEIYAMAVDPTFDLNNTKNEKSINIFSDPLVENVYELGSVIKPLTVATGIDTGKITPDSTYYDSGFITVNGKKISNFDGKERGTVTIQTALSESLNVGMAHIVSLVGNKTLTDYFKKFGLAEKTNIDLPNEAKNLIDNLDSNRDIEHVTASFGQGIALSPISAIRSLSSIANGGYLVHPHIVTRIDYKLGNSKTISYPLTDRVIQANTSETVTRMMVKSVDQYLQNGKYKMPQYSIAVKTGTAQIASGGVYSKDDFLHSFVGFAPAYNPRFIIFIYTVKPRGVQYSSESLSPAFFDTMQFLLNYYEVPPDR